MHQLSYCLPHTVISDPWVVSGLGPAGTFDIEEQIVVPHHDVIADIPIRRCFSPVTRWHSQTRISCVVRV